MNKPKDYERLDKFLSGVGVASRRGIKILLKTENVTINGKKAKESGLHIDPIHDVIELNGERLKKRGFVYYMLNKPKGVVSTTADERNRENVVSLIATDERIYPIGRLDKDTTGLILLTNDGPITQRLTHPKFHVPKVYHLTIVGSVEAPQLKALREGVLLRDGVTAPAEVEVVKTVKNRTTLRVTLHEGRNRQIRRMCETVGINLVELDRVEFGELNLEGLDVGKYRVLSAEEIAILKSYSDKK